MDQIAVRYGVRPSVVAGVSNTWDAYQFDAALCRFGIWIDNKLAELDSKGRPLHTLKSLLSAAPGEELRPYKDPITGKTIWSK